MQAEAIWAGLNWPPQRPLLLACSGGADSLALLHLLQGSPWTLEVAYLDHGSSPCPQLLRDYCARHRLRLWERRLRVERWARRYGMSWEAAARQVRYAWLAGLGRRRGALVLTAHTADDQAETLLFRLLQGTTLAGLAGIEVRQEWLARPLLGVRRQALRDYLRAKEVDWREDPMNQDSRFLRVALRQQVLPLLEQLNGRAVEHLAALANDGLELRRHWEAVPWKPGRGRLHFEHQLHACWTRLGPIPGARWERFHAQRIWEALDQPRCQIWDLPGRIWCEWDGQRLRLGRRLQRLPRLSVQAGQAPAQEPWRVVLDPRLLTSWEWRARRPGDRWQGQLLKKALAAWRMPRPLRDHWPLLIVPPHQVVWVPGWRVRQDLLPGGTLAFEVKERSELLIVEAAARDEASTC